MTMPTAQEIVCLYLYGQRTPPADLKTDALIRPPGDGAVTVNVDRNDYMTNGGGRFVKVENFQYVLNFLAGRDYSENALSAGTYTRNELLAAYGITRPKSILAVQQYYLGMGDADYMDRAYVFGSSEFEINEEATFIVHPDGSREIVGIAVVPRDDNFDYESDSPAAQITNGLTINRIDPSGIGRQVSIKFTGTITDTQVLTGEDWYAMDLANKLDKLGLLASMALTPIAVPSFAALMLQFAASGIIDYKDSEGRFVYYDGTSPDRDGALDAATGLRKVQFQGALYDGSVALIGGGGNDRLNAADQSDELYGGADKDSLYGFAGDDRLDGGTEDDRLDGGSGADTLLGGAGKDWFLSGAGNDLLEGGAGDDVLWGSGLGFEQDGNDSLRGGMGYDVYRASGGDVITDDDGSGMVRMRQRIMDGAWRLKGETSYHSWDKQYTFNWNGSTLTISGNGDGVLTIRNFSNGALEIFLSETDKELPSKPPFDPNRTRARVDPLVLDVNHDGVIQSVGLAESNVFFDFNKDGIAEKSGWVGPQDGMLVNDLNTNGVVDDLGELFGSATEDGFASLKRQFDSDGNAVIDKFDEGFSRLRVWQDQNLDGISQTGELKTLEELHIESVQTDAVKVSVPSKDNVIIGTAEFVQDGQTHLAADMELAVDYALTDSNPVRPSGDAATLSDEVAMLPKLRGFGVVKDLAYASQDDPALLVCVQDMLAGGRAAVEAGLEAMVARWTGLQAAYARQGMTWSGQLSIEDKLWILESFSGVNVSKDLIESHRFNLSSVNNQDRMRFSETYINERFSSTVLRMELSLSTQAFEKAWLKGVFYSVEQDRFDAYDPAVLNDSLANRLPQLIGYDETVALARLVARLRADGVPLDTARLDGISAATDFPEPVHFALTAGFNLGTSQNDHIEGQQGQRNWLDGAQGKDVLISFGGDDMLHGGTGDDSLQGGEGSDVYVFNAGGGNDVISDADYAGKKGSDIIRLGAGITTQNTSARREESDLVLGFGVAGSVRVRDYFYADVSDGTYAIEQIVFADASIWDIATVKQLVLVATAQSDLIKGYAGNDSIQGLAGDDKLYGGDGNDSLRGGTGNDLIDGGDGDDLIFFDGGNGRDVVQDYGNSETGADTLKLGSAFSATGTTAQRVGRDLNLRFAGNQVDQLTIKDYFYTGSATSNSQIERIEFSDGTVWSVERVRQGVITPTASDDILYAFDDTSSLSGLAGNDRLFGSFIANTLTGGRGKDSIEGGRGSDTYVFERGDGKDAIYDHNEWQTSDVDTVKLGTDIAVAQTRAQRSGQDLLLDFGQDDGITIRRYFDNDGTGATQIERIEFDDGTVWDVAMLKEMVQRGAEGDDQLQGYARGDLLSGVGGNDLLDGAGGNDSLLGGSGRDTLLGSAGHDTLDGGTGNDVLDGESGDNSYLFDRGDGEDVINSYYENRVGRLNTLVLGPGIAAADVALRQIDGTDLELALTGGADKITVRGFFDANGVAHLANPLQKILFSDGSFWDNDAVMSRVFAGSAGHDTIRGTRFDDVLHGQGGDDALNGAEGDDLLLGGGDADMLSGADGNDVLDGGAGNDALNGGSGDNVYRFGRGDGEDTVAGVFDMAVGRTNVLQLKAGVAASDIGLRRLGAGELEVSILGTGDRLIFKDFLADDDPGNGRNALQRIRFDDGTDWDLDAIKARLFAGTAGDDLIRGTLLSDRIHGGLGKDSLSGAAGDDVLIGGAGNDLLNAGLGNNEYLFDRGDGQDTIAGGFDDAASKLNVLAFGTGVAPQDIQLRQVGAGDLEISLRGTDDCVFVRAFFAGDDTGNANNGLQQIRFADGTVWMMETIEARLFSGTERNDILRGTLRDDLIHGGAGSDKLNGAAGADALHGDEGDDSLDGGAGVDQLAGGKGNDIYFVDTSADVVVELADAGVDTVRSTAHSYALAAHTENLILDESPFWWTGLAIEGMGNDLDNVLIGNSFANRLEGQGGLDILIGGTGNDVYVVDTSTDVIQEDTLGGIDTVEASVSYSLTTITAVENLSLTGTAHIDATGNEADNGLLGNRANNILDGGEGSDRMAGGAGDDVYFVDTERNWQLGTGDVVIEQEGEGKDTIVRSIDTTLILEDKVENLTLSGAVYRGNGNALDNVITGNDADNNLLGLGGNDTLIGGAGTDALFGAEGQDMLIGGAGDDYYEIDDFGDTIVENAGEGDDFVRSSVGWTLGAHVERLALDGTADLAASGNTLGNGLWGNSGNNLLTGAQGSDFLSGGAGNDVYVFNAGDGQDTIDNLDALGASDTLRFGTGIAENDVSAFQYGDSLFFKIRGASDQIAIANHYAASTTSKGVTQDRKIDRIEFANGTVWDQAMIQSLVDRANNNRAPTVSSSLPALKAMQDSLFSYVVPLKTITDPDGWDSVTYSAKMGNGDPLPSWLSFDSQTRTLSGTPTSANTGQLQFVLWGTDNYGFSAGTYVSLTVSPPNRAPVLATALADQSVAEGTTINYTVPNGSFVDPDVGDSLSYSATLSDGKALPSWLSFSASTRRFLGMVPVGALDSLSVQVTATDRSGLAVQDVFALAVTVQDTTLNGTASVEVLTGRSGNDSLDGKAGNDRLVGNLGNDRLMGGAGNDALIGGPGNDTYLFGRGDGADTVQENDASAGNVDVLRFLQDITVDQVWFRRLYNNLEVSLIGTSDKATISDWYLGSQYQIEQFQTSDGQALLASQVNNLVSAMAAFAPPAAGQTTLPPAHAQSLNAVIAANWN